MKMTLEHLPPVKQQELQTIVQFIRQHDAVEMIILFGSYARGDWAEEYAEDGIHFEYQSDYDLLVIVKTRSTRTQKHLEIDMMTEIGEHMPDIRTPVSIIVHDIEYINHCLENAQYFFSDIKKQGIILYDSEQVTLTKARQLSNKERYRLAKDDFKYWFNSAKEFRIGFEFDFQHGRYSKAAFELHQTAERLYTTILIVLTRYKPKIHDLAILRRLTNALDPCLIKTIPLRDSKEKGRFYLLCNAYVDARYKKEYSITPEELTWLAQRVKELEHVTETLCKEKIQGFLIEDNDLK